MDQMGEVDYAAGEPRGTSWHPHRGFETVTYMIDGAMQHQDSHGGGGLIRDGATQWMTAGGGILHIETPPAQLVESGGLFHGIQLWVNLPAKDKMIEPRYQGLEASDVTLAASPDGGALVRVIAGEVGRPPGPGRHPHPDRGGPRHHRPGRAALAALAARTSTRWPTSSPGTARSAASGRPDRGRAARRLRRRRPPHAPGRRPAGQPDRALEVLLLGGRPIGEPVAAYGPFVMNTRAELAQAVEDFQAGRLGVVPDGALMPHRAVRHWS